MEFKVGDRVNFTNNSHCYVIRRENPLVGTEYECEGVVYNISNLSINVLWDNGIRNVYRHDDLSLSSDIHGSVESFWE
jgi:hypothetical protein